MEAGAEESVDGGSPTLRSLISDRALLVVLSLSFVGVLGNAVASPAMPRMVEELGVSEARVGLVLSVFFLGALFALPVAGFLMDWYGRRPVILSLLFLFVSAGTAIVFVRSFDLLLACRFLQGVGFAGTIPLSVTLVGDLYSGPAGSSAQGFRVGASGLARIVVPAVAGLLVGFAWFAPFSLNALALVVFGAAYLYLPETMESDGASETGEALPYLERIRTAVRKFVFELRDPALLVLLGGVSLIFLSRFTITTFVPLYAVQTMGSSYFVAGLAISVIGIPRLIVAPFAGMVEARFSKRTSFVTTIGMLGLGILLVGVAGTTVSLFAVLIFYGVGDALYNPILNNAVTELADEEHRGRITSVMEMLKTGAITLSPAIFGPVVAVVGYDHMFAAAGILALLPVIPTVFVIEG